MTPPRPSKSDDAYLYNRPVCIGFAIFALVMVASSVAVVILAGDEMFLEGFVPGWLFGSVAAAMFSVVGLSWVRRLTHSGPGLVLSDSGITSYNFAGTIRWDEITSAYPGRNGSVILDLRSGETFLARQSLRFRLLQWNPSLRRKRTVSIGSVALATSERDLLGNVQARVDRARLESTASRLVESDGTAPEAD